MDKLRDALFCRAYHQGICEYETWDVYRKEQWKSLVQYGREDLLDLTLALLSSSKRIRYPLPALDLAAYTLAKFGLERELALYPVQGYVLNSRTSDKDLYQIVALNVKFGNQSVNRIHFTSHLLARCAVFIGGEVTDYTSALSAGGVPIDDVVLFGQRELQRIIDGNCPYEKEAERLRKDDPDALRRARDFFYEEKWQPAELKEQIEGETAIELAFAEMYRNETKGNNRVRSVDNVMLLAKESDDRKNSIFRRLSGFGRRFKKRDSQHYEK